MGNSGILGWYHPSTVVFVDDNPNFLESILLGLDTRKFFPKLFTDPFAAIDFISNQKKNTNLLAPHLLETEIRGAGLQNVSVDINAIHQQVNNPARFDEISLIVVDYAMPKMNGLDFCKRISSTRSTTKILMLTGEADDTLGVEAFNEGTIDYFIRKVASVGDVGFQEALNNAIWKLQRAYYNDQSKGIIEGLSKEEDNPVLCLSDRKFAEVFNKICDENDISEYYLLDTDGSFFLVNYNGEPQLFFVKNDRNMEDAYQVALNSDQTFPKDILDAMKKREKILCLYGQDICDDPAEVKRFLQPCQKILGNEAYYYALLKNLISYNIKFKNILSFKQFSARASIEV